MNVSAFGVEDSRISKARRHDAGVDNTGKPRSGTYSPPSNPQGERARRGRHRAPEPSTELVRTGVSRDPGRALQPSTLRLAEHGRSRRGLIIGAGAASAAALGGTAEGVRRKRQAGKQSAASA
jgi:hypothetical protein